MIKDVTMKYRDVMAFGLLVAGGLGVIGSLSLLFKSGDDLGAGSVGFPEKSAIFGANFDSGLIVLALVGAVFLVTRFGDLSPNARIVVLVALGVGAIDLLFAFITFFAQFGADSNVIGQNYAGVTGAGKIIGVLLGLAQLSFLVIGMFYVFTTFQSLPAPVAAPAPQWGSDQGFGQYGAPGQPAPGQQRPGQPWQQPDPAPAQQTAAPQAAAPPAWDQPAWDQQGWAQQGWGQQPTTPAPPPPGTGYGWAAPAEPQQSWGQPAAPASAPAPGSAPTSDEAVVHEAVAVGAEPATGEDTPGEGTPGEDKADEDETPPAQGWWQHPQQ